VSIVRFLLTRGNGKLGEAIHAFSLPAVACCPGRSALCERHCYAKAGRFRTDVVRDRLRANLAAAEAPDFVARVVREVRCRGVKVLRIHVAGDFHSATYTRRWASIARRCPATLFYAYSRSWRSPEVAPALAELAALSNFRLWYSADRETGLPADVPAGVKVAFMQAGPADDPSGASLVFRTHGLRQAPAKRVSLVTVCPTEAGGPRAADVTCTSCRRCYE
jgi:acetolactate synthase regulatory subunit